MLKTRLLSSRLPHTGILCSTAVFPGGIFTMPGMDAPTGTGSWTGSTGCCGRGEEVGKNREGEPGENAAPAGVGAEGRDAVAGVGA